MPEDSRNLDPQAVEAAMVTPRWAALARTDLDPFQIGSWDPGLPRDTRLLVPMDVQALVASGPGAVESVQTTTEVPFSPEGSAVADVVPRPPTPFGPAAAREPGVHLHWAMPDGLTRGNAGAVRTGPEPPGNPMGLRPLPDRWVVVRLLHGSDSRRSWVLEADRGDANDLDGWTEPGPTTAATGASGRRVFPPDRLTATAGGEAAWAATYDAVIDRFAFHDDLSDLDLSATPGARLSYLVAGWWSDPSLDPFDDVTTLGAYHARAESLGWGAPDPDGSAGDAHARADVSARRSALGLASPALRVSGHAAEALVDSSGTERRTFDAPTVQASLFEEGAVLSAETTPAAPRQTLLHGVVFGVPVSGDGPDLRPNPGSLELAVGTGGFGALAALLAEGTDEQRDASERALAAFGGGLLATIGQPGGLTAVDEDRHTRGFTATTAGVRSTPDRVAQGDPFADPQAASGGGGAGGSTSPASPAPAPSGGPGGGGFSLSAAGQTPKTLLFERDTHDVIRAAITRRFGEVVGGAMAGGGAGGGTLPQPAPEPRTFRPVPVPEPRFFLPADLAFVVRGAVRSFRHGGDGRLTVDGRLPCRLPSGVVRGYRGILGADDLPTSLRSVGSGAVPIEVDLLLREAVLTDPYRWQELRDWATKQGGLPTTPVTNRLRAEFALRYARTSTTFRDQDVLPTPARDALLVASLEEGEDPSPIGFTRWSQPWVPLWCDWELSLHVDDRLDRWALEAVDFDVSGEARPDAPGDPVTMTGRTLLTSSVARALSTQIRQWLDEERRRDASGQGQVGPDVELELADAAAAADSLDVLSGTFRGVREALLGLDPVRATMSQVDAAGNATGLASALGLPLLLAGGGARLSRLRLVDAFGRIVDVPDAVIGQAEIEATHRHPDGAPSLALAPRFQRPARLWFRVVDPRPADTDPFVEARIDQEHPELAVSPVAGWLLPDHVDESLEFFDGAGNPLGQLMPDPITDAVTWEGAPGLPGPVGAPPDPGSDPGARHLTRFAAAVVEADARVRNDPATPPDQEGALSAILRAIDTTLWTVDPLGTIGTSTVAGLVGRPIAVVRAAIRLDVSSDVEEVSYAAPADRDARARAYAELAARAITVRLGELTRTDDSLLAWFADDDYRTIHVVSPEILAQARAVRRLQGQLSVLGRGSENLPGVQPITHPYVSEEPGVSIRPGQVVRLTLLWHPGGRVHATCGALPRKSLSLARDWFQAALERLSPSFRIGPILVDPTGIRMPKVTGLGPKQVFTERDTPLTWRDDPILASSQTALLPDIPHVLREGWIRVAQDTGEGSGQGGSP